RAMHEEIAFQFAISLGDDVARLAYADWLEEHDDPRAAWVRDPAVWRWMAPDAHDPIPSLLEALTSDVLEERETAADMLPRLGARPEEVMAVLLRYPRRAYHAGVALSRMGDLGPLVMLLDRLARTSDACAHAAAVALSADAEASAAALPGLIARVRRRLEE